MSAHFGPRSLAVAGVCSLALALTLGGTQAQAAPGDLTFSSCISSQVEGCIEPDSDPVGGDMKIATSPDGRNVYVTSESNDSVAQFDRGANGALSLVECISDNGFSGCTDPFQDPLGIASDVVVAPDGEDVYVTADFDDSISHFRRDAAGGLDYGGCIADDGQHGCTNPGQDPLGGAAAVAISPDGEDLYVASRSDDSVSHFRRAADGAISYGGCIADDGDNSCANPANDSLAGAQDVAVSPDGADVYVVADFDSSISHFTRDENGAIHFAGCIAEGGDDGCTDPGADVLFGATSVAVSPDGSSVYVASEIDDSLGVFRRDAVGGLTFVGCFSDGNNPGCVDVPGAPLLSATDVTVSPDGTSVYVTANLSDAVAHFARRADGTLAFQGCLSNESNTGCAVPSPATLFGANATAVSPDGLNAYTTSRSDRAVTTFTREQPDRQAPETQITKGPKRKLKTAKKKIKAKFAFESSEPGSTFECRIDKKDFAPCASPRKVKLKRGKRRFEVRAIDAAGNVDQSPAARKVKVKRKR